MMTSWKPVAGYENAYEVSDDGRVRSVDRYVTNTLGRTYFFRGKILTPYKHPFGYDMVRLSRDSVHKNAAVHRLMVEAFLGPIPEGHVVRHLCGVENRLDNLTTGTQAENIGDAVASRSHCHGETHGCAILTEADVRDIRTMLASRQYTQKEIGDVYGVSHVTVSAIAKRRLWRHI